MNESTKIISIKRNSDGSYFYMSPSYDNPSLTECELLTVLGAVFGVTLTYPMHNNCSWTIAVTKFCPD